MCFGAVPAPEVARCFEISLVLYAEHGFNAPTFRARVLTSALSDVYSAITDAIGAPSRGSTRQCQQGQRGNQGPSPRVRG